MRALFLTALAMAFTPAVFAQDILFKQAWKPGFSLDFLQKTTTEFSVDFGGKIEPAHSEIELNLTLSVTQTGEQRQLSSMFRSVKGTTEFQQQKLTFDSNSAGADPQAGAATSHSPETAPLLGIVGKEVTTTLAPNGAIVEIKGLEQIAGGVGNKLDVTLFRELVASSHAKAFPVDPVPAGGSWNYSQPVELAQFGVIRPELTYRFEGMVDRDGEKVAKVTFSGSLHGSLGQDSGGNTISFAPESRVTGTFLYHPDWGLIVHQDQRADIIVLRERSGRTAIPLPSSSHTVIQLTGRHTAEEPSPPPTAVR